MLNFEEFEAWLRTRPDNEKCGITHSPMRCPVALWIQDSYNSKSVSVGTSTAVVDNRIVLLDDKLAEFIKRLDTTYGVYRAVSKQQVLAIVDGIKEGR